MGVDSKGKRGYFSPFGIKPRRGALKHWFENQCYGQNHEALGVCAGWSRGPAPCQVQNQLFSASDLEPGSFLLRRNCVQEAAQSS